MDGKNRYDYFLYGVDEKSKGKWRFAQCAYQHYFKNCGLERLDLFNDTYTGDFRNANNLLFFSISKFYYSIEIFSHFWGELHGKMLADAFFGTGSRMVKYSLNFILPGEVFDYMFVYKTFAKIKNTLVIILKPNFGRYTIKAAKDSRIGEHGITFYHCFSFPAPGVVIPALTSELLHKSTERCEIKPTP